MLFFRKEIYYFYRDNILKERSNLVIVNNSYAKNTNYNYVSLTNDFIAKDSKQIKNILFTIVNSGTSNFTFYCADNYYFCLEDFNSIISDDNILSNINNFVHPFNSFEKMLATTSSNGKINIVIIHKYSNEEINLINNKVEEIINNNITNDMNNIEKIEVIHNYIINNSTYANNNTSLNKASDILINGKGICTAYTESMDLFLAKFNINYYNISSNTHIWNLVNLSGNWYHLDLTYDDPVVSDGSNMLLNDNFLINTNKLEAMNTTTHQFDKIVYSEAN